MFFTKSILIAVLVSSIMACGSGSDSNPPSVSTNIAPTVDAGVDQSVEEQTIVTITGTASDPDGSIEKYLWTQVSGEVVSFTGSNTSVLTFEAPTTAVDLSLVFKLTVTDNEGATAESQTIVNVIASAPSNGVNLNVTKNQELKASSSYGLQSSDVYVDAFQLTKIPAMFMHAYADFNSDGHTDVLLSSGVFQSQDYYPFYLYLGDGSAVNDDYNECGGEVLLYSCDGFTLSENAFPQNYEGMQHPRKIITGDYNNDGLMDAFVAGHGYDADPYPGEAPALLLNTGAGFTVKKYTEHVGFYHAASSADIDNDGDVDIFILSPSGGTYFMINDGEANFTFNSDRLDSSLHSPNGYYTAELIDIDKDGYIDLLLAGHEYEGATTIILWGDSTGTYSPSRKTELPNIGGFFGIIVDIDAEDIDGDGDNDIILNRVGSVVFYEGFYIQILENNGERLFSDNTSESMPDNQGDDWRTWIHIQDLNNDGMLDVYTNTEHFINLRWFNNGAGVFIKQ